MSNHGKRKWNLYNKEGLGSIYDTLSLSLSFLLYVFTINSIPSSIIENIKVLKDIAKFIWELFSISLPIQEIRILSISRIGCNYS